MTLSENLKRILDRIASAALKSGRSPDDVALVAVSKTRTAAEVDAAIQSGVIVFGENRVQEAQDKIETVSGSAEWHLVGHLQRNKVRSALALFDLIHSVDSLRLARQIGKHAGDSPCRVLVQVNVSGEASKFGFAPAEVPEAVGKIADICGVSVEGLMTIGAYESHPDLIRPGFRALRSLSARIADARLPGVSMKHLSMGMTGDFEVAIEEGATMVRLGEALFGPRA